jgi:hypothetical protein
LFQHGVVALLGFGRGYVFDGLQEPSVIEPIDPFQGGELDGLQAAPWPAPVDHLGLVETVDGFGEGIVIGILPTEGSTPASTRRSVYLIETYWADSSGHRNIDCCHSW